MDKKSFRNLLVKELLIIIDFELSKTIETKHKNKSQETIQFHENGFRLVRESERERESLGFSVIHKVLHP